MRVFQAYRYAVDPSPAKAQEMRSHVGARRFAFNWGLTLVKGRLDARARGETVTIPWTMRALRHEWNRQKAAVAPWWRKNSKEAYNAGFDGLANGLKAYFDSRSRKRRRCLVAFPTFKKRGRGRQSVRFTTGTIKVLDRRHIQLPRIGLLRTYEPTTALLTKLGAGTARILSATASLDGDRWHVSFTCEVDRPVGRPARPQGRIGVDAGLRGTVLSTGEMIPTPRPLRTALKKLARVNRELARRKQGSRGWQETKAKVRRAHARVRHIRQDATHKLTRRLATTYGTVVAEHLGVVAMIRAPRMGRAVADAGMAELRRQLTYKCVWYGARLVVASRQFPSSKTCSQCGAVKTTLPLWERVFRCETCELVMDRDLNAAKNLAAIAAQEYRRREWPGDAKRPWKGRKTRSLRADPREVGSRPQLDRGGTAAP